jgi:hypothetical protein
MKNRCLNPNFDAGSGPFERCSDPGTVPLNRDGLSILLHPGTGDAYADHIDHAVWLGSALPLRMNVLRKSRKTPSHS